MHAFTIKRKPYIIKKLEIGKQKNEEFIIKIKLLYKNLIPRLKSIIVEHDSWYLKFLLFLFLKLL